MFDDDSTYGLQCESTVKVAWVLKEKPPSINQLYCESSSNVELRSRTLVLVMMKIWEPLLPLLPPHTVNTQVTTDSNNFNQTLLCYVDDILYMQQ